MSKQISAVEWLFETLTEEGFDLSLHTLEIKQAKAMEKEQIIDAHNDGTKRQIDNSELYYNETFKSE